MKRIIGIIVLLLALSPVTTTASAEQVLTIYFCGTGSTSEWYKPSVSKFNRADLVASLYQMDQSDSDLSSNGPRHKVIVDGVGTGSGFFLNILGTADPNFELARGWTACLSDAMDALHTVLDSHQDEQVVLNLVGFSRGGILCMKMARKAVDPAIESRIKKINILAFEPVPGETDTMLEMGRTGTIRQPFPTK